MKNKVLLCLVSLIVILFSASLVTAAEVSQGRCIKYDKENNLVTIEEYNINFSKEYPYGHPTGKESVFNVETALIGIEPEPGDIVRIAYDVKSAENVALRVMNVSKQDLRKK